MSGLRTLGIGLVTMALWAGSIEAQLASSSSPLVTRAERTGFEETSRYADVMAFIQHAAERSPRIRLTSFGYSLEGRSLPLVVVGDVEPAEPAAVRRSGKLRVFVQANIHAGEVAGKEAALMLIRALAEGSHAEWLDSLILLIAPIYNADGNERVRLTNRPGQHGPVGGMGQRANAQGLDLNRDHMKLESPEARSLVSFMSQWDPHVLMDLHTTNGTRRAYHLLYAPPLHPNTPSAITQLLRGEWLPAVTRAVKATDGWDYYYYGNLPWRSGSAERGWYTFDHRPRFNTNYIGLRNRFGILSEAYAYATFEERILATLRFVEEVVEFAFEHTTAIRDAAKTADRVSLIGTDLALRATFERSPDSVEILLGKVEQEANPYTGRPMYRRLNVAIPERMPSFGTFRALEVVRVPTSYLVPPELRTVVALLEAHGIGMRRLDAEQRRTVERFVVDSTTQATREFQGHRERTLFGRYEATEVTVPVGTMEVPLDQPLAKLVFSLLEPRSDDGVVNWNVLDDALEEARVYPILRIHRE
jgi:hypothetical protein